MNQLDYFAKILDLTYKSLEKPKEEPQDYCDRCEKMFPVSKLQTFEDSKGNDQVLCDSCEHNYPDCPNDEIDEDHFRGDR